MKIPKVSILIPYHDMENAGFFLKRNIDSIMMQTFRDYEVVLTKEGGMAKNTNAGIKQARGEIIKILYLDDYFAHENALKNIVENFGRGWLATGCVHDWGDGKLKDPHLPRIEGLTGDTVSNTIGSPSVIAFENRDPLLFDESMKWLLDLDYYLRLVRRYGELTIVNSHDVVIGCGEHQMTNRMSHEEKFYEEENFKEKWKTPESV